MAETTCTTPGCDKPAKDTAQEGMCNKCWKRYRETLMALGLWQSRRDKPKALPKEPGYKRPSYTKKFPDCVVDSCPRGVGEFGGEGRCKKHFGEYRDECVARGEQCPMSNVQKKQWDGVPGFHIEDWPEDQHAGLSIDGMCSVEWGCDRTTNPKTGRGLCGRHFQQWVQAYKRRGLKVPKRASGRDPRCTLPDDDVLVATIREHKSYTRTAKALGVSYHTLLDFLSIRPELRARMDAEWRLLYKPKQYTEEEARERARASSREKNRKRRLIPQQRLDLGGVTEQDALDAVAHAKTLEFEPCTYCGRYLPGEMQIDHIVALTRGGDVRAHNLTSACRDCNMNKSDRDLDEFLAATVELRAERYANWRDEQAPPTTDAGIAVLAIETEIAPLVSTSDGQLCLALPGEAFEASGVANAGPRPKRTRRGR